MLELNNALNGFLLNLTISTDQNKVIKENNAPPIKIKYFHFVNFKRSSADKVWIKACVASALTNAGLSCSIGKLRLPINLTPIKLPKIKNANKIKTYKNKAPRNDKKFSPTPVTIKFIKSKDFLIFSSFVADILSFSIAFFTM